MFCKAERKAGLSLTYHLSTRQTLGLNAQPTASAINKWASEQGTPDASNHNPVSFKRSVQATHHQLASHSLADTAPHPR